MDLQGSNPRAINFRVAHMTRTCICICSNTAVRTRTHVVSNRLSIEQAPNRESTSSVVTGLSLSMPCESWPDSLSLEFNVNANDQRRICAPRGPRRLYMYTSEHAPLALESSAPRTWTRTRTYCGCGAPQRRGRQPGKSIDIAPKWCKLEPMTSKRRQTVSSN